MANTLYEYYTGKGQTLPSIQDRASIYQSHGFGDTYQGTAEQNTALLGKLQTPPTPQQQSPAPNIASNTMSTDLLGTKPVKFPETPQEDFVAFPAPTIEQQAQALGQQATQPSQQTQQAQQEVTQAKSTLRRLQEMMGGKGQAQVQAEQAQGVPTKLQAVSDLQAQINQLQNESQQAQIALEGQGRGITTGILRGQAAQIQRQTAIKALSLNSFLYAAQGNLATAQDLADRAVAAQFDPIEKQLEYQMQWLEINYKDLTSAQKKDADQLQITLDERARLLDEQKAERKSIHDTAIGAAQAGASAELLNRISNAGSMEEALQIAASDPMVFQWATEQQRKEQELQIQKMEQDLAQGKTSFETDQAYKQAQTAKINAEIALLGGGQIPGGEVPAPLKVATSEISGIKYIDMSKLTAAQIPLAQTYAAGNNIPLLTKEDANALQLANQTASSAISLFKRVKEMADKVITAESPLDIPKQYAQIRGGALLKSNSDAAVFLDNVQAFSSLLTRAAGEKGVLTNMDIARILKGLPRATDTKEIAAKKAAEFEALFNAQLQGAVNAYLGGAGQSQEQTGNSYQSTTGNIYQLPY